MERPIVFSYGGGVQSVAIGVLIGQGALPVPTLAGIADTGRERRTTWEYLSEHMQPYLDRTCGLKIEVVPHTFSRVDLYASDGGTIMPVYADGGGRLGAYCSGEWKRDAMMRWYRSKDIQRCTEWIGFSIDEVHRAKPDRRQWCARQFPLIDQFINRAMCVALIAAAGLPVPSKSRCFCCPHQDEDEWREVRADPVDWPKAVAVDEEVRARDPERKGLYLYSGRVPLAMANFEADAGIVGPMRPCEQGTCWT